MKKMIFCVIPLIMAIMGCASGGTAAAKTSGGKAVAEPVSNSPEVAAGATNNSPGMDLDAAIKEAAARMGAKLPAKTTVALISVASTSAQLSEYIISRLEAALVDGGKLVVVDRANLDKVRAEQGFQLSGEVDDNSAKEIGRLAGAGAIVTGAFSNLGDVYGLTLKAIDIVSATVAVSYPADIVKSARIETLLAADGGATGTQTRTAQAVPASPQSEEPLKTGVWKVSGSDEQRTVWSADLVIQTYRDSTFIGYFDWYSGHIIKELIGKTGKEYKDILNNSIEYLKRLYELTIIKEREIWDEGEEGYTLTPTQVHKVHSIKNNKENVPRMYIYYIKLNIGTIAYTHYHNNRYTI